MGATMFKIDSLVILGTGGLSLLFRAGLPWSFSWVEYKWSSPNCLCPEANKLSGREPGQDYMCSYRYCKREVASIAQGTLEAGSLGLCCVIVIIH